MNSRIKTPEGDKIEMRDGRLRVPDRPIIPFIEGDGIGPDITRAAHVVFDAAVRAAYGDSRRISWMEVYAGEKANAIYGPGTWLPDETLAACRDHLVSIKGPLTTPVGGGIRSINVAMRQNLDLYVCLRPVRWFKGVPSPVKHPELTDMVIFRENTEDIYAGIEWMNGTPEADKVKRFLLEEMGVKKIRFPKTASIGVKPVSVEGTERLVRAALDYAVANDRRSVTLVHKGNIQKFTEGAFRDWGYALARREYGATPMGDGPWCEFLNPRTGRMIVVKDCICDAFLQQILTRPAEYDVIATLNLNGDYVSDALAATVGGIGIAPGANINRHRARREHQLPDGRRRLRGHARHRAEVREPRQGQSRIAHPLRRDDAQVHGLDRGRRQDHRRDGQGDRRQDRDLRLRPPDGERRRGLLLGLRRRPGRRNVAKGGTIPCE